MARKKAQKESENTPAWEWIFAAIGFILVAGSVSMMIYRGVTEDYVPAHFSVTPGAVTSAEGSHIVPFSVKNLGSQTAASLTIEGSLSRGEQTVETSSVTVTYVPANSIREGVIFFTKNPGDFELRLRAMGYEKP